MLFRSDAPQNDAERDIAARYDSVKGSAVNPVLREGNSDRRSARAVKLFAMKNPHSMGNWNADSKTHVSSMRSGDFFNNEKSATLRDDQAGKARIEFEDLNGNVTILKDGLDMPAGTVVDASFISLSNLRDFLREQLVDAKRQKLLFSVHLKATMMKVSDPIIFGQAVQVLLDDFIAKHRGTLDELGFNVNLGLADLEARIAGLPAEKIGRAHV